MSASVAAAIIDAIAADGFSVGEHEQVDLATGLFACHVDATDAKTGETWVVNAPTAYESAFELAVALGWDFSEERTVAS